MATSKPKNEPTGIVVEANMLGTTRKVSDTNAPSIPPLQVEPLQITVRNVARNMADEQQMKLVPINFAAPNMEVEITRFNRAFNTYMDALDDDDLSEKAKAARWRLYAGEKVIELCDEAEWPSGKSKHVIQDVIELLKEKFKVKQSKLLARAEFGDRRMKTGEDFETWLQALKVIAKGCGYTKERQEEELRDHIIRCHGDPHVRQELLMLDEDVKLDEVIKKCKAIELAKKQAAQLAEGKPKREEVNALNKKKKKQNNYPPSKPAIFYERPSTSGERSSSSIGKSEQQRKQGQERGYERPKCRYCHFKTGLHRFGRDDNGQPFCPAYGKRCDKCKRMNHLAVACWMGEEDSEVPAQRRRVNEVETRDSDDEEANEIQGEWSSGEENEVSANCIEASDFPKAIYDVIKVGRAGIKFKIDCGATTNVLSWKDFLKTKIPESWLKPTSSKLVTYSKNVITPIAKLILVIRHFGRVVRVTFHIIEEDRKALLGCQAASALGYIQMKCLKESSVTIDEIDENASNVINSGVRGIHGVDEKDRTFEGAKEKQIPPQLIDLKLDESILQQVLTPKLGKCVQQIKINLKPGARPVRLAARRVAIPLRDVVKKELTRMLNEGVIEAVTEPSAWCSTMLVVDKKNGAIRICLDPRVLNEAIDRAEFQMPDIDTLLTELVDANYVTMLDLESGFWQIPVDEESAKLMTFATPYGRFRFKRLAFGLKNAPEEFHRLIFTLLEGIEGVTNYIDDIIISGKTKKQHDERVKEVITRLAKANLSINFEKSQWCKQRVSILGHIFDHGRILPDPSKIEALVNFPDPQDKSDLQRFLGMLNFLRKFVPRCADETSELCSLLKKDAEFVWCANKQAAMNRIKGIIRSGLELQIFKRGEPLELSCDASSFGLGAVLMQAGKPIAFVSKTMTESEKKMAQIDKELMALVFGFERFYLYTYGSHVQAKTDHKPLIGLIRKPLADVSVTQQRLLMKLMKYDFDLTYVPGKELIMADFLSRAPLNNNASTLENSPVMGTDIKTNEAFINELEAIPTKDSQKQKLVQALKDDAQLNEVKNAIMAGWPARSKQATGQFWTIRHDLFVEDDVVFFKGRVVVPSSIRKEFLVNLHQGHPGINSMMRRAEVTMYWPGLSADIKEYVRTCGTCIFEKSKNQREPACSFEIPKAPGAEIVADHFEIRGVQYVAIADAFSGFTEAFHVANTGAAALIKIVQNWIMRQGRPLLLRSDQGSAFDSREFREFAKECGMALQTNSPDYPRGNSLAELAVKRAKKVVRTSASPMELVWGMLALNQTPISTGRPSPAEIHFGRNLLDQAHVDTKQKSMDWEEVRLWKKAARAQFKANYDEGTKALPELKVGDKVLVWQHDKWQKAKIQTKLKERPRSYRVELGSGRCIERNRQMLKRDSSTHDLILQKAANNHQWATVHHPPVPPQYLLDPCNDLERRRRKRNAQQMSPSPSGTQATTPDQAQEGVQEDQLDSRERRRREEAERDNRVQGVTSRGRVVIKPNRFN